MASSEGNIVDQLQRLTECSICISTFTDPRILPCVHTFCLKCLENTASSSNKRPGDEMLCPTCRTVFTIPPNGFTGFFKNFNMNSLITMANDAILKSTATNICSHHTTKPLDAFCLECEQPVCILCLTDNHQGHKASDIVEVREIFSKELADYMKQILSYKEKSFHLMRELDEKKKHYLKEIDDKKSAILKRSKELIDRIERNTKSLLEELSSLKDQHLAQMEKEREEVQKHCVIMEKNQTYYEATVAKASLADICDMKKELPIVVETLDEWFKMRKISSFEVLLHLQDKVEIDVKKEISNIVGRIKGRAKDESQLKFVKEKNVIVVGSSVTNQMLEFNLNRPNEICFLQLVPTEMQSEAAAVYSEDKLFLIGIGEDCREIWKFESISGWEKCANLDKGKKGHCANIVATLIYICGGWNPFSRKVLKSLEAYDLQTNRCSTVGELVHAVEFAASVAYKGLIYVFGGRLEESRVTNCVQIYNPRDNTCSLFLKPMPFPQWNLRALLWNNSVILLNKETFFVFDFEKKIWRERKQFRTGVNKFGLVHDEKKIYIFGGIDKTSLTRTDEIKCVLLEDIIKGRKVEWKHHGRLPKPILIYTNT